MSSSTKRILFFFLLITTILVIFHITSSSHFLEEEYSEEFNAQVTQQNAFITEYLKVFENAVAMFSQNETIRRVTDDPDTYYDSTITLFKTFQESYPSTAFAYFYPINQEHIDEVLISWPNTSQELKNSGWVAEERPWYIRTIDAKGKIAWTEPYADATTDEYTITVAKQVFNEHQTFTGIVAVDLYLNQVLDRIRSFKAFNQGTLLIMPSPSTSFYATENPQDSIDYESIMDSKIRARIFNREADHFLIKKDRIEYYIAYETNVLTNWKIVGIVPKKALMKSSDLLRNYMTIGVLLIILIGGFSIIFASKQMVDTVKDLSSSISSDPSRKIAFESKSDLFVPNNPFYPSSAKSEIAVLYAIEHHMQQFEQSLSLNAPANQEMLKTDLLQLVHAYHQLNISDESHLEIKAEVEAFLKEHLAYIQTNKILEPELFNSLILPILNSDDKSNPLN